MKSSTRTVSSTPPLDSVDRKAALMTKFQELKEKREEAVALNLENTKVEDAKLRLNSRVQARLERKREQAETYFEEKEATEKGIDLERQKNLQYTIEETEAWNAKQASKTLRTDPGLSTHDQLALRKYDKLTARINPEALQRAEPDEAIENMTTDLQKQLGDRAKFSRRRKFVDDEDVTYINQRNYRFNKKIERAYGQYTEEMKQNLERGTAL